MTSAYNKYEQIYIRIVLILAPLFTVSVVHAQSSVPPLGGIALAEWLQSGHYKTWQTESAVHGSAGPHFGKVRAFLNPTLLDSMNAQSEQHPRGSVAVKELYGDGDTVRGWAVAIKIASESSGGANWYWYEIFDNNTVRDEKGVALCSGCHSTGRDYVLTPWPLQ
jgi:hypothetical protein